MEDIQVYYLYRRMLPSQFDKRQGQPKSILFHLRENEDGLSVFDSRAKSPREVLQQYIDNNKLAIENGTEVEQKAAQKRLTEYPNVEAMVDKGWQIVKIPKSAITALGLELSDIDNNGHLLILGVENFNDVYPPLFINLVINGIASLVSREECLKK